LFKAKEKKDVCKVQQGGVVKERRERNRKWLELNQG
jgi:hypothetical protein